MAESESSGAASQLPSKSEATTITIKINTKLPRRQLTLIAITCLLNVLLWSSIICLITTLYQIASDPDDSTNVPSEVLTLTSSLVTIAYIILHTIFSLKQRIWRHQGRHPSIVKKTSYIAIRVAVTLCVLWLLTSGWNMITVARRPVCLSKEPGLKGWEAGVTCRVGRVGIAFAMVALLASCTLFGMLSIVRRPFEAHLLKHGYRPPPVKPRLTPGVSRRPSPTRSASFVSEKYLAGRISASTHRSTPSSASNTDVETLDLNSSSPPATIHSPSPIRSIGLGIFTSHAHPPPLPSGLTIPQRSSSLDSPPPVFYPSASNQHLPPPPRMSALVAPSGFVPLSIPAQYSASAWRAVHPPAPSPLGPSTARSNPHLAHSSSVQNFSYRSRFSRSSVSLTRPRRLSTATPAGSVAWSSRSASTGPDEGRRTPGSTIGSPERRATANEIAYAILNGTTIPGTVTSEERVHGHIRRASAPDATVGAQQNRKGKPWKPQLKDQEEDSEPRISKLIRSSSAELLSKFSPDSSPDDDKVSPRHQFERDLDFRMSLEKFLPFRKIRSADPIRYSDIPGGAANILKTAQVVSRMPQIPKIPKAGTNSDAISGAQTPVQAKRMTYDDVKNKPLPKIAAL